MARKAKMYAIPKVMPASSGSMGDTNRMGVITNGTAVKTSVMTRARQIDGARSAPHCVHDLVSFGFSRAAFLAGTCLLIAHAGHPLRSSRSLPLWGAIRHSQVASRQAGRNQGELYTYLDSMLRSRIQLPSPSLQSARMDGCSDIMSVWP